MKINLADSGLHLSCAPLSLTRPIGGLRCGVFTNTERALKGSQRMAQTYEKFARQSRNLQH